MIHRLAPSADPHEVDAQAAFFHETLALGCNLLEEASAHISRATNKDVDVLIFGKEEAVVEHIECLAQHLLLNDKRDVHLKRALPDGTD